MASKHNPGELAQWLFTSKRGPLAQVLREFNNSEIRIKIKIINKGVKGLVAFTVRLKTYFLLAYFLRLRAIFAPLRIRYVQRSF